MLVIRNLDREAIINVLVTTAGFLVLALVMDVYTAADLSDELGEPVTLPRNDPSAALAAK